MCGFRPVATIDLEGQVLFADAQNGLRPYGGIAGAASAGWSF